MRPRVYLSLGAAALAVALGGFGCASQQSANTERYQYLTGSYAPQDVQRNGPVSNGANNVRVIDQSDVNHSGGADVSQSLRQLGVTR